MEEPASFIIKRGKGTLMNSGTKLKHDGFWNRMERATKQVDRWPTWVKGSPKDEGNESTPSKPSKASTAASKVVAP